MLINGAYKLPSKCFYTQALRSKPLAQANFHYALRYDGMRKELPATRKWVSDRTRAEHYEVSRVTIWRWEKIGKLPAPQKIGENTTRWDFDEITAAETQA